VQQRQMRAHPHDGETPELREWNSSNVCHLAWRATLRPLRQVSKLLHLLRSQIGALQECAAPHHSYQVLLWGGFCQGSSPRVLSIFSSFGFFVRPGSRFFAPTHTPSGRRAEERSRLAAHWAATDRLGLDGSEHDGILVVVGMTTSEGSSHVVHEQFAPHPSIRWAEDPDHDAVMRIGSESSEAADPF
jgi:hypothetical protein